MSDEVLRDLAAGGYRGRMAGLCGPPHVVSAPVLRRVLAALGLPRYRPRIVVQRRILSKRSSLVDLPHW